MSQVLRLCAASVIVVLLTGLCACGRAVGTYVLDAERTGKLLLADRAALANRDAGEVLLDPSRAGVPLREVADAEVMAAVLRWTGEIRITRGYETLICEIEITAPGGRDWGIGRWYKPWPNRRAETRLQSFESRQLHFLPEGEWMNWEPEGGGVIVGNISGVRIAFRKM